MCPAFSFRRPSGGTRLRCTRGGLSGWLECFQGVERFFQPDECLSEGGGGAGDVDAGEAFATRSEDFAVVEPQSGLVRDEVIERLAAQAGTISYEILCDISKRIPRIYMQDGREQEILQYIV